MFRFFESLIDPYQAYDERAEFPARLIPFYLHMLRPAWKLIAVSMVLGFVIALVEIMLIRFASELIDILGRTEPGVFWDEPRSSVLFMAAVVLLIRPHGLMGSKEVERI